MALTYRSPIEEVLTLLEPASQSLIANTATTSYQKAEKENFSWFNYSMPAIAKEHLSRAGIYLSPFSGYPHSHPVCKTLENYMLYKVLPDIINNTFFFVGIKNFKLNFLKRRFDKLSMVSAINRYVSSADKVRYGNEFVVRMSSESRLLRRHRGVFDSPTLRDLVPNVKTGSNLFLHDELHYWSKNDLIAFLEVCKPEMLLGTLVYPTEVFVGASYSLNPWCYEFEVRRDKLLFYPDGVRSEGYEQPLEGGFLLQTSKLRLTDGSVYCVDLISSKFAHHLVSITRGDLIVPTYRSFGPFEAIRSEGLGDICKGKVNFFPVSHPMVLRVYRYLRSLKKPDKQSAMAKFSQLNHEPSGLAVKFMEEFSDLVIGTGSMRTMINAELLKSFFANLGRKLPKCIAAKIKITRMLCLDEFIATLKPLCVDVRLLEVQRASTFDFKFYHEEDIEADFDLESSMELGWRGSGLLDRVSTPYVGLAPLTDTCIDWSVHYRKEPFLWRLKDLYVGAMCGETHKALTSIGKYVASISSACNILARTLLQSLTREDLFQIHCYVFYMHYLKHYWWGCKVKWFTGWKDQRAYCSYLEGSEPIGFAHHFERVDFSKTRLNWINAPLSESDIDSYYAESVLYEPVLLTANVGSASAPEQTRVRETEEEEIRYAIPLRDERCDCGLVLTISSLPYAELREDVFPDVLRGRSCACTLKTWGPIPTLVGDMSPWVGLGGLSFGCKSMAFLLFTTACWRRDMKRAVRLVSTRMMRPYSNQDRVS